MYVHFVFASTVKSFELNKDISFRQEFVYGLENQFCCVCLQLIKKLYILVLSHVQKV